MLKLLVLLFHFSAFAGPQGEAYFSQFLYQAQPTTCDDPDFCDAGNDFKEMLSTNATDFLKAPTIPYKDAGLEGSLSLWVDLYLNPDKTYVLVYRENLFTGPIQEQGFTPMIPFGCHVYRGTWSVPEDQLVLSGGEALGDRLYEKNQDGVKLTLQKDLKSPGGKSFEVKLLPFPAAMGPDNLEFSCIEKSPGFEDKNSPWGKFSFN